MLMTSTEFAASIKAKYPQYQGLTDADLVTRMLAKYPQYKDQISDSVADTARMRLASGMGVHGAPPLTPEGVKAGRGVTTPEQIQTQPPKEVNGGFGGGFMQAIKNAPRSFAEGAAPSLTQPVNTAIDLAKGVPFRQAITQNSPSGQGAAVVDEAMRRGAANESTADMYGNVAGNAAMLAATKGVAEIIPEMPAVAERAATRGRNAQIGATPKDIALGGDPGRGVAAISPKSLGGFGRAEEIASGLDAATEAKTNFMANDSRAQMKVFNPDPLIKEAVESKAAMATSDRNFRNALTSFANRMRASVSGITGGEQRALSAVEMDRLRGQIDANWNATNKQFRVVTENETKMNDAHVDMDRALRQSLESEQSPIGNEYKALNQRIQDLTQAKTVQGRTNEESMAPAKTPLQQKEADKHVTGVGLVRSAVRANPAGASPLNVLRNPYYSMLAKIGGLKTPLPSPDMMATQPPVAGLSEPNMPTPGGAMFAAGDSGPAYDVSPVSGQLGFLQESKGSLPHGDWNQMRQWLLDRYMQEIAGRSGSGDGSSPEKPQFNRTQANVSEFTPENTDLLNNTPQGALFPPHFNAARSVVGASPIDNVIRDSAGDPVPSGSGMTVQGLYGEPLPTPRIGVLDAHGRVPEPGGRGGANTIQTTREAGPSELAHEYGHAIRERDLPPQQVKRFDSFYESRVKAWRDAYTAQAYPPEGSPPLSPRAEQRLHDAQERLEEHIPEAVLRYERAALDNPSSIDIEPSREAFAQLNADYIVSPQQFKAKYPEWYGVMRALYRGREYVGGKITDGGAK